MAVYKVPQDVEADDKLLGPFSFRQFIYLIIVALAIGMGYLLSKVFIGLALVVAPIVIFFGALALPLKKDQPMEAYLGAMVSFYFLKPRKRFWQPDGLNSLVEITAPKQVEPERAKDISQDEAKERLDYLTSIVDSRGWAVRGVGVPTEGVTSLNNTVYTEAQTADDMLDDTNTASQKFDTMLDTRDQQERQQLVSSFQQQAAMPPSTSPQPFQFNPYPQIHQSVVQPLEPNYQTQQQTITSPVVTIQAQTISEKAPSPDIISLANTSQGLTVASVEKTIHHLEEKDHGLPEGEVEISLHKHTN